MKLNNKSDTKSINKKNFIDKQFLFNSIIYNWKLLNKSISFWIISAFYLISNFVINLVFLIIEKSQFLNFSFLIYMISLSFCLFFIFYCVAKLFLESKYTSIDLIMVSKPYNKINIYIARFILILMFIFAINTFNFIVVSILTLSFGLNVNWVLYNFVSYIFIGPFIATFLISLFILFAILLKKTTFALIGFLSILIISILPIITRTFDSNFKIQYSDNGYNSFAKLITCSNEGNIDTYLVDKINVSSNLNGVNGYDSINGDNFWNYLIPGEWFGSLNSSLTSNLFDFDNYSNQKFSYSFVKSFYRNENFINSYKDIIVIRPEDINPLSLTNNDYENLLIDNIEQIINNTNNLNLKDGLLSGSFLTKLKNKIVWNESNLSYKEYNTLSSLFGLDQKHSQLFYYWNYYPLLSTKTPNLLEKIKLNFNKNFADLLDFIYTSNISYMNVYNQKVFGNVNEFYPTPMIVKENEIINKQEIDFIANNLIRFNGSTVSYLDTNDNYRVIPISELQKLSPNIINDSTWNEYVLENTLTYSLASSLLSNLNTLFKNNIYQMILTPNYLNVYQYSYYLSQFTTTYLNYSNLLMAIMIVVTIFINVLAIYKYKSTNYKNFNI